ncbi:helix-turn-helix domain-containing protein [Leptospira wolffii]|uniref:helix-turn-helix domain-containing protein n=1 Tax=Leptospira wolffii TaxID=409998 RepID=UPI00108396FA|nr:helix-turn-helix domain-containing protein [Leptospira wolffii]TGK58174.1 helix-turn-helix domain-containing protein [Leptospira wolffii]TGK68852.1 helix-turn-helix domain-containing protein [Leptospira wolffii]TGK76308.1 helix-turn-helix domain-containing protein [Leptospira wolffii]TGL27204.1 helix-turn-helix domain-containing protein [Leptospira wolffii]
MILELERVRNIWPEVKDLLSVPHSDKQYKKLLKALDELIDEVGNNEKHPLAPLMETVGNLIEEYEKDNFESIDADPVEVLKYLMEESGFTQKDMSELGSQGVVSEILNGKRELNVRQIKALGKKFKVSPAVFI